MDEHEVVREAEVNKAMTREMSSWLKTRTLSRFNKLDSKNPIKMKAPTYQKEIKVSTLYGILSMTETLLVENRDNSYNSVEEVMGDLQLMFKYAHNELRKYPEVGFNVENQSIDSLLARYSNG